MEMFNNITVHLNHGMTHETFWSGWCYSMTLLLARVTLRKLL